MLRFILLLIPVGSIAQSGFSSIDRKVAEVPFADVKTLATQLASLGNTDREKVRAIFRWITENIDYNIRTYNRNKNFPLFLEEPDDSNAALPPLDERIAAKVLNRKLAFCDGYSRLFKTLCMHAGIKAEIIFGYARTNTSRRFGANHTWNAVYLDSSWHLLDVTWASGFVSWSNEYVRSFNEFYFLTPPEQFIRDHYPEDPQWTLMSNPPVYREYAQSPFRYSGFIKSGVTGFFPAKGVIEAAVGDTISIELKTRRELKNLFVSSSPVLDTLQLMQQPLFGLPGGKFSFKYSITPETGEWLYVFCNEELALRYKLNLKRTIAISTSSRPKE